MNRVSAKKREADLYYSKQRQVVRDRARGLCEIVTPACPDGPHRGDVCHHKARRKGGPPETMHDPAGMLWLCDPAHRYVHDHTAESYVNGWLTRSTANL